jgi:DNA-binding transcriptional LysR family regulator
MELRHLRYFVTVATSGGFAKAARQLSVSQSAISEQVRDLEDELGVPLIDRAQHRTRLTPHGVLFLEEARRTLAAAERAVEVAQRSARGEIGTLVIGFFVGGTGDFFAELIRDFRSLYPKVRVSLAELTPSEQQSALIAGAIDIGFTRAVEPEASARLEVERLYTEPLFAVMPKTHRLAESTITLPELSSESFIVAQRDTSPVLFDKVISLCAEAGFSPRIVATASVSTGVLTLVHAGEGIAILPRNARYFAPSELAFRPIEHPGAAIDLVVAWPRERQSPITQAFLTLMRQRLAAGMLSEDFSTT